MSENFFHAYSKLNKYGKAKRLKNPMTELIFCNVEESKADHEREILSEKVEKWKKLRHMERQETPELLCRICESTVKANRMNVGLTVRG